LKNPENWEKEMLLQQITNGKVTERRSSKAQISKEEKLARLAKKYESQEMITIEKNETDLFHYVTQSN
jgi:hypothetical protein